MRYDRYLAEELRTAVLAVPLAAEGTANEQVLLRAPRGPGSRA